MSVATSRLIMADSHLERPPGLRLDELPEAAHSALPLAMRPTELATQFALRIGTRDERYLTPDEIYDLLESFPASS